MPTPPHAGRNGVVGEFRRWLLCVLVHREASRQGIEKFRSQSHVSVKLRSRGERADPGGGIGT